MPATIDPPAAPAAAPAPAPAAPPAPSQNAPAIPPPISNVPPPKPGSAKARMFGSLEKYAADKAAAPKPGEKPAAAAPAAAKADDSPAAPESNEGDAPPPKPGDKPGEPAKKPNPWDLYKQEKEAKKALETRIAELESKVMKPEQQKEWETKTARLKELEDEIRYTNYQKSQEFQDKYQKPYDAAWQRAVGELGELTVTDGEGGERPMNANDLLDIVNLPLQQARKAAVEKFGDFADDVMDHRKEILRLYSEQRQALDTVKKEGEIREKQQQETRLAQYQAVTKEVQEIWNSTNEAVKADEKFGKYFTPVEGDQEGNQRLAKGFELADRAFSENPMNAKNAEERKSIVQRHAAVRNRAAAFGKLVYQNSQLEARFADMQTRLARYEGSEPSTGGSQPAKAPSTPASAKQRLHDDLMKFAK